MSLGALPDTLSTATRVMLRGLSPRDSIVRAQPVILGTQAYAGIAMPVVANGAAVGAVVRWSRIGSNPATEAALRRLVDPRADLYDSDLFAHSLRTANASPGWQEDPDVVRADFVLIQRWFPLAGALASDPHVRRVYAEHLAAAFVRQGAKR